MTNSLQRAIIIGGGMGGLAAAITLRQVGFESVVRARLAKVVAHDASRAFEPVTATI